MTAAGTTPAGSQWAKDGIPTCRTCARAYDMCGAPLSPVPGLDYGSSWNKQVNCFADCAGRDELESIRGLSRGFVRTAV